LLPAAAELIGAGASVHFSDSSIEEAAMKWLKATKHAPARRRRSQTGFSPFLEAVENRLLLASFVQFNPTGGGLGGTTNFGTSTGVSALDESIGNAIAVGFTPVVGSTFTLDYQASINSVTGASAGGFNGYTSAPMAGDAPYTPIPPGVGNTTGQLTAVANFQETVTSVNGSSVNFATIGTGGTVTFWFNPTIGYNNLSGINFAPGTPGNTVTTGYTEVYQGSITPFATDPKNTGTFAASGTGAGNPLDQAPGGNQYPATSSVNGQGSSQLNAVTTFADPDFFTSGAPASVALSFTSTTNKLPFNTVQPAAIFFNGQAGVATVGTVNGAVIGAGGTQNVMFQADASTSFGPAAAVPEPGTISAALTGIGFAFLAGLRAHRRRNKATAV
jgi:hypothetical protein